MARTVEQGFRIFLSRLTPAGVESEAAMRHRESIKGCLRKHFGMTGFFRSGSFGNGTSIRAHSDVDYFAVIPPRKLSPDSAETLAQIREALDARFPNTGVMVRPPAVVVWFARGAASYNEYTEVVPAFFLERSGRFSVYGIPDGRGGWMRSSPEAHKALIAAIDSKRAAKVKPLIRFLKAWKYLRNVPISSFYLELTAAHHAAATKAIGYPSAVENVLWELWRGRLAPVADPMGVSGYVQACDTTAKLGDALSKLETALGRAQKALRAEISGNIRAAFDWWCLVFGNRFPTHG